MISMPGMHGSLDTAGYLNTLRQGWNPGKISNGNWWNKTAVRHGIN